MTPTPIASSETTRASRGPDSLRRRSLSRRLGFNEELVRHSALAQGRYPEGSCRVRQILNIPGAAFGPSPPDKENYP